MSLTSPQKFLSLQNGLPAQTAPASVGGPASAYAIPGLNAAGQLDVTMLPTGVGPDTQSITASEAIAAGALVNVWNNAGAIAVRNADNSSPSKAACGFVLQAVASGAPATVYFGGVLSGVAGLTPGQSYFLGSAGAIIPAAALPTATGSLTQSVGVAISATQLAFQPGIQVQN